MPSERFRITTNGQSLRNPNNGFFDMTLSANMTLDESDVSAHNDRRSAHNALERQRREHLNGKFQQLAHALPALQTVRRPSKTMIVAKSLEFVSSSLKRETNFMSEIQKLRLENDKLRKQAAKSTDQLKKRQRDDEEDDEETDVKEEPKMKTDNTSLERNSSSDSQQLSPPPTPEAMRDTKNVEKPVIQQPLQKKMKKTTTVVKQTKTLPTQAPQEQMVQPMMMPNTPWSPLLDDTNNLLYPTNNISSPPNYFDMMTPPNNMLFNTPPPPIMDMYQPTPNMSQAPTSQSVMPSQYHQMMYPMLLSPYFIPSDAATVAPYSTSTNSTPIMGNYSQHQRQHSNSSHGSNNYHS